MRGRHLSASGALLASALWTTVLLVRNPHPWHATTAVVLASSLVIWATVAVVAILLENSRLGYWLGLVVLAVTTLIAVLQSISWRWWVAMALLALAALLFSDPALGGWVRRRSSAAPVPILAVLVGLALLTLPGLTAVLVLQAEPEGLAVLAAVDLVTLFVYVRRVRYALLVVRVIPLLLAIAGWWLPDPGRWLWIAGHLAVLALAWRKEVRLAVRPLIERGTKVMIPPELAPEEIREMLEGKG